MLQVTGLSALVRDISGQPTGIPMQVSKKWDESVLKQVYEAGYDQGNSGGVTWWTISIFLRVPPVSEITLEFTLVYNMYGGVPSFSNSQLSALEKVCQWQPMACMHVQ